MESLQNVLDEIEELKKELYAVKHKFGQGSAEYKESEEILLLLINYSNSILLNSIIED